MKYIYFIAFLLYGGCLNAQLLEYMSTPDWYHDYDIKFYKIDIEVNNTTVDIKGSATINAKICKSDLDHFTLELAKEILVDSVFMDGKAETYRRDGDLLYVLPSVSLIEGEMHSVRIVYHTISGTLQDNSFFSGISNRKDNPWDIAVTWTLSEPENAKKWFPCKQYLPDKADSAYIFLTVPDHLKAGAPGVLHSVVPLAGGKHRYEWKTNYPIAYYLLSFAVSDYSEYNIYAHPQGVQDSLLVQNYIYNRSGYLEANRAVIDTTKVLIELYSKLYIPYPFANEKYGHCVAPMGGGMEHQTMTTISDFDFSLVAHELAHQWFGNLVTCASFQDIWINEGFTSYSEYLALEYLGSIKDADEWMKGAHAMACWSHKGSVFIPKESANDTWRIFSMSLSYKKGAALVHTIRHIIDNDELFFDVLRGFLQKYAYSTASAMDFKTFVEEKTNIDFTPFFVQWYLGEGFPIIDFSWTESDGQLSILMDHIGSAGSNPLFTMNIDLRISRRDGTDTIVKLPVTKNRERYSFAVTNVSHIDIDPRYYILKEVRSNTLVKDLPSDDQFIICKTNVKRKQDLTITFKEQTNRNCQVLLTDPLGGKVFIKATIKGEKGTHVLPMSELNNGDYLLYIKNGRDQYVRKIVKTSF